MNLKDNVLEGVIPDEEMDVAGMFALVTGNHIDWANSEGYIK